MWVEHSKSQSTDDKSSLKWAWSRHVTHFKFLVPQDISGTAKASDFKCGLHVDHSKSQPTANKLSMIEAWSMSRDLFKFWNISDYVSKMVRDSLIVSSKFE